MVIAPAGIADPNYRCSGVASVVIPDDDLYYLTTFGGGADAQHTACGRPVDGSWFYIAGERRFGCGARVAITNPMTGVACVAEVVDDGPACFVEESAGGPVIDASPLVAQHLFGTRSIGWSDRKIVRAELVDRDTPLGPYHAPSKLRWIVAVAALGAAGVGAYYYVVQPSWFKKRKSGRWRPRSRWPQFD